MDAVESNRQTLLPAVVAFVQTCVRMASLPGGGNAPSPPGKAVISGSVRKRSSRQLFGEITSA